MALVSGGRSTLNPNAPLYIPAALRQVEDFSPEWWELITTSPWFHDYWLSQHQEAELYYNNNNNNIRRDCSDVVDVADLLPDDIDFGIEEDLAYMDSHTQGLTHPYVNPVTKKLPAVKESKDLLFSAAKLAAEPPRAVSG